MSRQFKLSRLNNAPLLTPATIDESTRYLGEGVRLLDAEPVIVVNLDHLPFGDAANACREMLFAKDPNAAIVVIDPTHSTIVPPSHDGPTEVKVVDTFAAAAVGAQRLQRRGAEPGASRVRRFRIRRSIV